MFKLFRRKNDDNTDSNSGDKTDYTRVEVTTNNNVLLYLGNMKVIDKTQVEIHNREDEQFGSIIYNTPVKLKGYKGGDSFVIGGKIRGSSPNKLRICDIELLTNTENRRSARQVVMISGEASTVYDRYNYDTDCYILDISSGGVKVSLNTMLKVGSVLKIKFEYTNEKIVITCVIKRIIEKSNRRYVYGCQFTEDNNKVQSDIARIVMNIERDNIKKIKK